MDIQDAVRLVVFLSEDDRFEHQGIHDALLTRAHEDGIAGATVWRGIEGFTRGGHIRSARFPDAATGLPLTVEFVDLPERIESFLPVIAEMAPGSLVTRERIQLLRRAPSA
ncbi:MAG TPA: DUF190 domain-containing protein [Acidimicrobiales bacterium]|nr:DUF190 domain-containing protein [Acidimicrobiales bacterium]